MRFYGFTRLFTTLATALAAVLILIIGLGQNTTQASMSSPDITWGGSPNPHRVGDTIITSIEEPGSLWDVTDYLIEFDLDERLEIGVYTATLRGDPFVCEETGRHVSCQFGQLAQGDHVSFEYATLATTPGEFVNNAKVEWHRASDGVRGSQYGGSLKIVVGDDSASFSIEGDWIREGDVVTLTSVFTAGVNREFVPFTTTLGAGLKVDHYTVHTTNSVGCDLSNDFRTLVCHVFPVVAQDVIPFEVYAVVTDDPYDFTATLAVGAFRESFVFKYSGISIEIPETLSVGDEIEVKLGVPATVGWYNMSLTGLVATDTPPGCLPRPDSRPIEWMCEINTFFGYISFPAQIQAESGSISIQSPYGNSSRDFTAQQGDFCLPVGGQGAVHFVTGQVMDGVSSLSNEAVVRAYNSTDQEIGCELASSNGQITSMALRDGPEGEVITFSVAGEVAFTCGEVIRPAIPTLAEDTSEIAVRLNIQSSHRCFVMLPSVQR